MKHQALRPLAMMLSVLLAAAAPAQAGTVHFADVARLNAEGRRGSASDMRLRAVQQQGGKAVATGVGSPSQGGTATGGANSGESATVPDTISPNDSALVVVGQDPAPQGGGQVETVDLGDVTGTICDCGEIPYANPGGFPKWPLLGLAGIPFLFINRDKPPGTPDTTPPTTTIPEPATIMLFGSGLLALGARARRRRGQKTSEVEARGVEVV